MLIKLVFYPVGKDASLFLQFNDATGSALSYCLLMLKSGIDGLKLV